MQLNFLVKVNIFQQCCANPLWAIIRFKNIISIVEGRAISYLHAVIGIANCSAPKVSKISKIRKFYITKYVLQFII